MGELTGNSVGEYFDGLAAGECSSCLKEIEEGKW
jgi:hypothetical protein